jgi:hypothetical protein
LVSVSASEINANQNFARKILNKPCIWNQPQNRAILRLAAHAFELKFRFA